MEAIRKQATKLREQVAKQQQAVLKQFSGGVGVGGSENVASDETVFQQHIKLEKLYLSTRATKHFQRDVVRGVEGYIVTASKQVEIGTKLSEDSRKYGSENACSNSGTLSKVALSYSKAQARIENEHENLLKVLGTQVGVPLRAMVVGTQLQDARLIAQRYDRVRQATEAQVIDVAKRQARVRETNLSSEDVSKLVAAETMLHELKSNMANSGEEAAAAMTVVEGQQQRCTLQRLIAIVEAEKAYHQHVLEILDQLEGQMLSEKHHTEASPSATASSTMPRPHGMDYFFGEVIHPHQAESEVELTLEVGDYVVVRKVSDNGWAEGECKGKAGWFPFECVERRNRVLASKVAQGF